MTKLLIANGCSVTYGTELTDKARESWPAVLGNLLDVPVVNLACTGGSNRRMVRTTVSNVDRVCREAGVDAADALVMCMWTGPDRTEYFKPRPKDRDTGDPGDRPLHLPYEEQWFRVGAWRTENDKGTEAIFRYLHDDTGAVVNWLLDWLMLDGFLRARGATARYAYAWHLLRTFPKPPEGEIQDLIELLDPATVYGGQTWTSGQSFNDISVAAGFAPGRFGHPLAGAHANFAALLAKWLTDTGALTRV
jgi:hypothetical protein